MNKQRKMKLRFEKRKQKLAKLAQTKEAKKVNDEVWALRMELDQQLQTTDRLEELLGAYLEASEKAVEELKRQYYLRGAKDRKRMLR